MCRLAVHTPGLSKDSEAYLRSHPAFSRHFSRIIQSLSPLLEGPRRGAGEICAYPSTSIWITEECLPCNSPFRWNRRGSALVLFLVKRSLMFRCCARFPFKTTLIIEFLFPLQNPREQGQRQSRYVSLYLCLSIYTYPSVSAYLSYFSLSFVDSFSTKEQDYLVKVPPGLWKEIRYWMSEAGHPTYDPALPSCLIQDGRTDVLFHSSQYI